MSSAVAVALPPPLRRNADFRRLWASQAATVFGYFTIIIAVPLLVFSRTQSALLTGIVAAFETLAYPLMAPWAGVAADRVNRRLLMLTCDAARVLLYGSIPFAAAFGGPSLPHVFAVALVAPLFSVLSDASALGTLTAFVRREELVDANARLQITQSIGSLVGPALAGVLIARVGEAAALATVCVTFACSFVALFTVRRPFQLPDAARGQGSVRGDLTEGLRFLWRQRTVRMLSLVLCLFSLGEGGYALLPIFALRELGVGKDAVGLLYAANGIGALASAFLVARVSAWLGIRTLTIAGFGFAAVLSVAFAFAPTLPVAVGILAVRAVAVEMVIISIISLRQRVIPDALQGRVNIVARAIAMSTFPLSALLVGSGADTLGLRTVYALLAGASLAAAVCGFGVPRRAEVEAQIAALQPAPLAEPAPERNPVGV